MFRALATRGASAFRGATMQVSLVKRVFDSIVGIWTLDVEISPQVRPGQVAPSVRLMSSSLESDAEFDARFAKSLYFKFLSPRVWNFSRLIGILP